MSEPLPQCPVHAEFFIAPGGECPRCGWPESITVKRADLIRMYEAIDDLWSVVEKEQIMVLQPKTIETAKEVHAAMWHGNQVAQSESH